MRLLEPPLAALHASTTAALPQIALPPHPHTPTHTTHYPTTPTSSIVAHSYGHFTAEWLPPLYMTLCENFGERTPRVRAAGAPAAAAARARLPSLLACAWRRLCVSAAITAPTSNLPSLRPRDLNARPAPPPPRLISLAPPAGHCTYANRSALRIFDVLTGRGCNCLDNYPPYFQEHVECLAGAPLRHISGGALRGRLVLLQTAWTGLGPRCRGIPGGCYKGDGSRCSARASSASRAVLHCVCCCLGALPEKKLRPTCLLAREDIHLSHFCCSCSCCCCRLPPTAPLLARWRGLMAQCFHAPQLELPAPLAPAQLLLVDRLYTSGRCGGGCLPCTAVPAAGLRHSPRPLCAALMHPYPLLLHRKTAAPAACPLSHRAPRTPAGTCSTSTQFSERSRRTSRQTWCTCAWSIWRWAALTSKYIGTFC